MTREEWLEILALAMQDDRNLIYVSRYNTLPKVLSSFPSRSTRRVVLGDFARQTDGTRLALVSPLLSSSLEVACVVYWLLVRSNYYMWDARTLTNRGNSETLQNAGFNMPFNQCIPTERLLDTLEACVNAYVARVGEYPAADVNPEARRTQSTRLLKVVCHNIHEPYILRMSASQFERGAPKCGVCGYDMTLG